MNKLFALFIHLLTSLGIVAGFFALLSVLSDEIVEAFLWLCLAFFIDGVDGPLARRFKVKEVAPNIKGEVLDNIVDYFNYVITVAEAKEPKPSPMPYLQAMEEYPKSLLANIVVRFKEIEIE